MNLLFFVAVGDDLASGYKFYGPFKTFDEAAEWCQLNGLASLEATIYELHPIQKESK